MAFHTRFKKIVERMPHVRDALVRAISTAQCEIEYSELASFFEKYQYTLDKPKQSQSGSPALEQLKEEQEYLRQESLKKDQRIRSLLNDVDQKNMELQKMGDKNRE